MHQHLWNPDEGVETPSQSLLLLQKLQEMKKKPPVFTFFQWPKVCLKVTLAFFFENVASSADLTS